MSNRTHTEGVGINTQDRIGRRYLVAVIQMGVDIGGRSNITVSKPFLDVLQRNAVCIKQAGAAVTKIVKTNLFQSLLFEKQVKMLCDEIGFDQSAHCIYIDVVQIIRAVAITTDLLIECLFCFKIAKQNFKRCNKRKCTATGFGLGRVLLYHLRFAIHGELYHRMSDTDGFAVKINGIPFQTNNFAAAQAIECAKDSRPSRSTVVIGKPDSFM